MASLVTEPRTGGPGGFAPGIPGDGDRRPRRPLPDNVYRVGMILALSATSMMFAGLTSAYVVSQGLTPAWRQVQMSPLIWINTSVLIASSLAMEQARRRALLSEPAIRWLMATLALGLLFLLGQIGVFFQLSGQGLYLSTGRQSSFYYVLTALHGLHILGGILALAWAAFRMQSATDLRRYSRVGIVAIFWHFMGALWLYLLAVLFVL